MPEGGREVDRFAIGEHGFSLDLREILEQAKFVWCESDRKDGLSINDKGP